MSSSSATAAGDRFDLLVVGGGIVALSAAAHFRVDSPVEDPAFASRIVLRPGEPPAVERWS